jgi:probable rRNA maturation factor
MSFRVQVLSESGLGAHRRGLARAARSALAHEAAAPGEVSVLLTGIDRMQRLNAEFMGVDRATDVLSFPSGESAPGTRRHYYGDIAVCIPYAQAQALRGKRDMKEEVELLVVHGVLHLLGHDHDTRPRRQRMWKAQKDILEALRKQQAHGRR